jgi:hypothetical protein
MIDQERDLIDHPAARFLGREFLLWLWWKSEREFGTMELPHYGRVDLWIDDRLQFRTPGDDPQTSDLKGGAPATTAEARTALLAGKTVEVARIGLRIQEREHALELRGEGLELAGVKVPGEVKDGFDERIFERMFLLEEVTGILDALYAGFCGDRLGPDWDSGVLPEIRTWIAGSKD